MAAQIVAFGVRLAVSVAAVVALVQSFRFVG
jgi:hypothetical protein